MKIRDFQLKGFFHFVYLQFIRNILSHMLDALNRLHPTNESIRNRVSKEHIHLSAVKYIFRIGFRNI